MSDNWIVQNLNSALNTWNEKLAEIWTLLTQSPESFKGGTIWSVITGINGALTAIGYGLLVLFFAAGIVKTCGSFTDMKKPEHALKAFIRFALAQGAIMYGMELMTALFSIVQGIVSTIMAQSGMADGGVTELPAEIVEKIEAVGMLESIPLWIVTLLGSLLITVLSFIMILTVYTYARPFTKESLLYREIFEKYYPGQAEMIAGFWMPNKEWEGCDVNDPSARVLSNYGESGK